MCTRVCCVCVCVCVHLHMFPCARTTVHACAVFARACACISMRAHVRGSLCACAVPSVCACVHFHVPVCACLCRVCVCCVQFVCEALHCLLGVSVAASCGAHRTVTSAAFAVRVRGTRAHPAAAAALPGLTWDCGAHGDAGPVWAGGTALRRHGGAAPAALPPRPPPQGLGPRRPRGGRAGRVLRASGPRGGGAGPLRLSSAPCGLLSVTDSTLFLPRSKSLRKCEAIRRARPRQRRPCARSPNLSLPAGKAGCGVASRLRTVPMRPEEA